MIAQDIGLRNKNISKLGMVGLEIKLNPYAGLTSALNENTDNYYVGPDTSYQTNNLPKLKIYGNVRKKIIKEHEKYKIINKPIEIYDLKDTFKQTKPKIVKIFRPVIDISKIFENYGFFTKEPEREFYNFSDNSKSNWNIFYKPLKISIGDTYKKTLLTVYSETTDAIWRFSDLKWDGQDFR